MYTPLYSQVGDKITMKVLNGLDLLQLPDQAAEPVAEVAAEEPAATE